MNTKSIRKYDAHVVHSFGEFRYAFNYEDFYFNQGGNLELWREDVLLGGMKTFPTGMALEDVPDGKEVDEPWLLQLGRSYMEVESDSDQMALFEAAFTAAKKLRAAGVVSEWDEAKSNRIWERLAPKFNATLGKRMITVGSATPNPRQMPVYIATFERAGATAA